MDIRQKKKPLMGLIGGIGVVAALAGLLGFYSINLAILLSFGIWIVGALLVKLICD